MVKLVKLFYAVLRGPENFIFIVFSFSLARKTSWINVKSAENFLSLHIVQIERLLKKRKIGAKPLVLLREVIEINAASA